MSLNDEKQFAMADASNAFQAWCSRRGLTEEQARVEAKKLATEMAAEFEEALLSWLPPGKPLYLVLADNDVQNP